MMTITMVMTIMMWTREDDKNDDIDSIVDVNKRDIFLNNCDDNDKEVCRIKRI